MSLADAFLADLEDIEETSAQATQTVTESALRPFFKSTLMTSLDRVRLEPSADGMAEASDFGPAADLELAALQLSLESVYSRRFSALIQIIPEAGQYVQVVNRLSQDPRRPASFEDLLPRAASVALTVTASTASPLTAEEFHWAQAESATGLQLLILKREAQLFLERWMPTVAPNLSTLLGVSLAARLAVAAGGVAKLASMPAQNIESVGAERRQGLGLGLTAKQGLIWGCDLVRETADDFKRKAVRLLVSKAALAARADQFGKDPEVGARLRAQVEENLRKAQAPGEAKQVRILPIPIDKARPKRGGARHRKMKEKYGASEFQKKMNRVKFGEEAELESAFGARLGMVGQETGGSLRGPREKKRSVVSKASREITKTGGATFSAALGFEIPTPPK